MIIKTKFLSIRGDFKKFSTDGLFSFSFSTYSESNFPSNFGFLLSLAILLNDLLKALNLLILYKNFGDSGIRQISEVTTMAEPKYSIIQATQDLNST